jgi:CelD/BcsL family acetyltransferase involved in cellulose biosynthesis
MIYILHFDAPYHHARHYVGYCADGTLDQRLQRHRAGQGSRLMLAIELAGIGFTVALTHPGDRHFERTLKRAKNTPRFCPLCSKSVIAGRRSRPSHGS